MVRTLTAGATTAKEAQFAQFDVLVESEELDLRYSLITTNAGGHTWEQRLLRNGLGDIIFDAPPGGGIASVSTVTLRVIDDNTGKSPTAIINDVGKLKGADIAISILFAGEAYADKITIYANGIIDDHRRSSMITELVVVDGTFQTLRMIPQEIIPQNDVNAAVTAIGLAVPLVYGDGTNVQIAPMLLADQPAREYRVASHPMRVMSTTARHSIYIPEARLSKDRTGDANVSSTAATLTLTKPLSEVLFGGVGKTLSVARTQGITNSSLAIDASSTTFARIDTNSTVDANGEGYGFIGIAGAWTNPQGEDVLQYSVSQHKGSTGAAATVNTTFKVRLTDSGGTVVRDDLDNSQDFRFFTNYRDYRQELRNIILEGNQKLEVLIETRNEGGLGSTADFWEVGDVDLTLGAQADGDQTQLYLHIDWEGRADDTSGTYTGTASALIDKPSDLIWNVIGEELGTATDSASFVAARGRLTSWLFSGGIGGGWFSERETSREFLHRLAIQAKSILFPADDGLKLLPYDGTDSSQYAFTVSEILWTSGTDPASPPSTRRSTFEIDPETLTEPCNVFEIHYNFNPGSQRFESVRFANPDGTNSGQADAADLTTLCVNSANRFGRSDACIVQADFIYDDDTAEFLLDHVVRYFWDQRLLASWETGTQGLHLQVGDFVTLNYPDLPTVLQSSKFELHQLRYRFTPVESPSGQTALSFRIGCLASRLLSVGFGYFCIKDQSDQTWYGFIPIGQTFAIQSTVPSQAGLTADDLTPVTVPHWLQFTADDDAGTTIYVYPDDTSSTESFWIVDTSAPAVGTGWVVGNALNMRSIDGVAYDVKTHSAQYIFIE